MLFLNAKHEEYIFQRLSFLFLKVRVIMICFEVDANLNGIVLWRVKFNYDVYHNGQVSEERLLFTSFTLSVKRYFANINCK